MDNDEIERLDETVVVKEEELPQEGNTFTNLCAYQKYVRKSAPQPRISRCEP